MCPCWKIMDWVRQWVSDDIPNNYMTWNIKFMLTTKQINIDRTFMIYSWHIWIPHQTVGKTPSMGFHQSYLIYLDMDMTWRLQCVSENGNLTWTHGDFVTTSVIGCGSPQISFHCWQGKWWLTNGFGVLPKFSDKTILRSSIHRFIEREC